MDLFVPRQRLYGRRSKPEKYPFWTCDFWLQSPIFATPNLFRQIFLSVTSGIHWLKPDLLN